MRAPLYKRILISLPAHTMAREAGASSSRNVPAGHENWPKPQHLPQAQVATIIQKHAHLHSLQAQWST
jgi:hypothetical protein